MDNSCEVSCIHEFKSDCDSSFIHECTVRLDDVRVVALVERPELSQDALTYLFIVAQRDFLQREQFLLRLVDCLFD